MSDRDKIVLEKILKYIHSVLSYVEGMDYDAFIQDEMRVSATAFMLGQIGEVAKEVSETLRNANPDIPWIAMRNMRNRIVHNYENVDLKILWATATNDLPQLSLKIESLLQCA